MTNLSQTRPLGAQISHMLAARGVETIFGIPGVHNQEMYRGIEEAGITHVLARHEQGAGFMADGYARATGRPGVCYVITGPGVLNALTPLGQAYSDSVPVLMIASCLDETAAARGQLHQMLDQEGAAATVTAWSGTAQTAAAAYQLIDRALIEFETDRPRPRALHVPISALEARAAPAPAPPTIAQRPQPGAQAIAEVSNAIFQASRPLLIFGGGASGPVRALLDASGGAAFTTYAGGGLLPDHPLNFGCYLGRPGSAEVIASADLVVAFGTELAEVDLWRTELGHEAPLVRVDLDPEVLGDHHAATLSVQGDAGAVIAGVVDQLAAKGPAWTTDEVAEARARWRAETDRERPGIVPICDAIRDVLPDDAMIYSDMTQFAYVAREVWDMPRPGHWHHPTGFGTLGYALPAAIGGAVARTGAPTLALLGDYGFQYTLQELGTAVELGLPLPILLWDNGKLGEIEDSMVGAQIPPNAVIARNPEFVDLARAYGAYGVAPSTLEALQAAVTEALSADAPTLIHITPKILG